MATVKIDLVDGHRATLTRRGWESVDRTATVTGVTGAAHERLKVATDALAAAGTAIGSAHPSLPGVYLESIAPEALAPGVVKLRLTYKRPEPWEREGVLIETGATLEEVETNTDINGTLMEVEYTDANGVKHTQGGTVSVGRPRSTTVITRTETGDPDSKADNYVGKLNAGAFRGKPAKTVRCNAIVGTSRDGGRTYQVRYEFERSEDWRKTLAYRDPETGRPPSDLVDGTGLKQYGVYDTANFGGLRLPAYSSYVPLITYPGA